MSRTNGPRKFALPALACALLWIAGALLVWSASQALVDARRDLSAARADLRTQRARLASIAEEEREVKEKLTVYRALLATRVIGAERRLDWADTITRVRAERDLLDVRYRIERQTLLRSAAGKPAPVDFFASSMRVQLALLHEEDLLRFLYDLRQSGNAFHAVRNCQLQRAAGGESIRGIVPRLHADCRIDLITIIDRGAKP
ncbi:MAG: hypothetical protein OEW21_20000 [Betaproteobacteria bacterium]|nr:hypothetical protein [Betaproteobacteria bacterium]